MREHEEESEISITRRHIEERRKAYSRKRRRALFKLMLLMLIGGVFISAVLACTFLFIRMSTRRPTRNTHSSGGRTSVR